MTGKIIVELLKASTPLMALVEGSKIFPYAANENTPFPFIIYGVGDIDPEYTKSGHEGDNTDFTVACFSDDYSTLQDITKEIRSALELQKGTFSGKRIGRIYVTGQQEGYNDAAGAFGNRLSFTFKIN